MEALHKKREPTDSDFHLDLVKVRDLSLTIYQNCPNRPLELTIYSLKLPRLRQHWLLRDIFDADHGHGMFDNCLFSVENLGTDTKAQRRLVCVMSILFVFKRFIFILFLESFYNCWT